MSKIRIAAVVAVARNGVIGRNNDLPWHLPPDLKYFKSITMGKPIIMGRKTFESIGRPLPGRDNIVVTRDPNWRADGILVKSSIPDAIEAGTKVADEKSLDEVMIIGGAEIYRQSQALTDRIYLTEIDLSPDGDSFYPMPDPSVWAEHSRVSHPSEDEKPAYSFVVLDRR